ncbi:endonuclease [Bifidobacteriaceae bacterium WP022]|nr:endonuclease [Bifidobacteriaceae bacterium WP022]DAY37307.1 MAG TPA: HNH endonuclease [Caudoviricetes sp.]
MTKPNPRRTNGARRDTIRRRALAYYNTCYICGQPIDKTLKTPHPMSAEVDEIIPVSRGGSPYEWNNIRLTHRRCNRIKSTHSIDYARAKVNGTQQSPHKKIHFKSSQW